MAKITTPTEPEYWLRGPIEGISSFLQPAAHALLQSRMELSLYTVNFPDNLLWEKPSGCASVGFHMQHLTGVLDRIMTYAQNRSLSEQQFQYLKQEGQPNSSITVSGLVSKFDKKVEEALLLFKQLPESELTMARTVGRKKLPSTVLGLLFHAAEHSQRHIGQMLVTIRVL
ncbi:DinB family protein [Arenibacter certesii]|uniref:DinB-like domain-containing protein n=1 Tax=Arenibacter certesii TaxID=228955 RepID=A0A918MJX0_9FLAO|nr:DinB family protein [Arenibacter certesii]GGW33340.1 hypothetical protein GCM10007383_18020 [Arenibacter certesii]